MHSIVIIVAKYFIVFPVLLLAITWFMLPRADKKQAVLVGFFAALATGLLAVAGSKLYYDPRPFVVGHFTPYFPHGADNGFPSDHTLLATLCAAVAYMYNTRLGLLAFIFAVLVGISRVIAGVHHATDIIGSMVFACVATIIVYNLVQWRSRRS